MAEKRMFAKTIIDSDAFLDMPATTQLLYFHLSMRADDDGFINNPKRIMRICSCNDDDIKHLINKRFIIPFETGIVVIKHWKIHNYIAKDRYHETKYKDERALLSLDENNAYTTCIQPVYKMETETRLDKTSIDKTSIYSPAKAQDIIKHLNDKAHKKYHKDTETILKKIKARMNEGFTVEDFKKVIDIKCAEWIGTNYEAYLRPETLFGTKFESYLNQKPPAESYISDGSSYEGIDKL